MASWIDIFALIATLSIIAAIVYAYLYAQNALPGAFESAKHSLKNKGLDISQHGLSLKTDKRFDHEEYLDATQRGFIKAFNASSAGHHTSGPGTAQDEPEQKGSSRYSLRSRLGRRSEPGEK